MSHDVLVALLDIGRNLKGLELEHQTLQRKYAEMTAQYTELLRLYRIQSELQHAAGYQLAPSHLDNPALY